MAPPKGEKYSGAGQVLYYDRAPMSDGSKKTLCILNENPSLDYKQGFLMSELSGMADIPRDGKFHFHRNSFTPLKETRRLRSIYPYFVALGAGLHMAYRSYDIARHDGEWGERWIDRDIGAEYKKIYVMRDPL